jgi:hypothetical protein
MVKQTTGKRNSVQALAGELEHSSIDI